MAVDKLCHRLAAPSYRSAQPRGRKPHGWCKEKSSIPLFSRKHGTSALRGTPSLPRVTRVGCIPTPPFDGTAHTPQAGWRRFQALSLGSHQMARLTRRSRQVYNPTDQLGKGVLLNADLGSLCLPIHTG